MKVLRRAIDKGYHDRDLLEHDPDLDPLRSRDDFDDLLTRVQEAE
jgi:hypothetical protein